ncbi:MAG: glycosyltransferase [Eisenbergiella sp.]
MYDLVKLVWEPVPPAVMGDGPEREHLQNRIGELGLEDQVLLLGNIPNDQIKYYCKACDLFLFASKSETQGIVLLEAMAAQVPVIAVKASGVVDVVKNARNGYMVSENREEMADKICRALENPVLYDQLSRGAQETAWEYLNTNIARRAEAGYQDAIACNMRRGYRHAMAND